MGSFLLYENKACGEAVAVSNPVEEPLGASCKRYSQLGGPVKAAHTDTATRLMRNVTS